MLSFLKSQENGKDTTVSSNQLFGQEETNTENKTVKPTLYFHLAGVQ